MENTFKIQNQKLSIEFRWSSEITGDEKEKFYKLIFDAVDFWGDIEELAKLIEQKIKEHDSPTNR